MISDLRLQHFRSYIDDSFEFGAGVNIIVGPNASGKTNLLEALLVMCQGGSYRARDAELVAFNEPWGRLEAHTETGKERIVKLVCTPVPGKRYELDGKPFKRLTLPHTLPVVLFEPNHLLLLTGSPEQRRAYMDDLLEQLEPGYKSLRQSYRRTLAQRNALLKRGTHVATGQVFAWNVRLTEAAGRIVRSRQQLTERFNQQISLLYRDLSHTGTAVSLRYQSQFAAESYESQLLKKLESDLELDMQRGFTGNGPHRDDLRVLFDDRPAEETASRGEMRTAVLALKIMELQVLQEERGTTPLLLLDDVFSELDGKRRHALTGYLKNYQTFITTTDADIVVHSFTETTTVLPLGT